MNESAFNALTENQQSIANLLNNFITGSDASTTLPEIFGNSFNTVLGEGLLSDLATDLDLTSEEPQEGGVTFAVLPAAEINNASGAYAADNNTIYLSEEFLIENADNPDAISNVVIDGIGHYLDAEANTTDSPGDEGEIFAASVTGASLTPEEIALIRNADDIGAVNINGENIEVEQQDSIFYVDRDATEGANDGTSWSNAYTDLQSALAVAGTSDQVWVAEGTYVPITGTVPPEDVDDIREVSFVINNGVDVYGGFVGNETSLVQRDWEMNETILSGNIGESGQADNSYHVVDITGSTNSTVIDGFTITGGQADGDGGFSRQDVGSGIFGEENASATIQNTVLTDNFASNAGGGLYVGDASSPNIVNTEFINNLAGESGGGAFLVDTASPNLTNSLFTGNEAQQGGAVTINSVYSTSINEVLITNSTFVNNTAGEGDSIYTNEDESKPIENSIFWNTEGREDNQIFLGRSTTKELPIINNSIIQGDYEGEGEGNISEDPLFLDPASDDYRLQLNSPGIDIGNNEAVANLTVDTEVANNPRIYNETVDLGAYEYGLYLAIDDVTIAEGNEGTSNAEFTVTLLDTLGEPAAAEVTVSYATANSSADSTDFTATTGNLVFAPGETTKTIAVPIIGDTAPENNETFFVNLSGATGAAVINDNQGEGIINDDDTVAEPETDNAPGGTTPPADGDANLGESSTVYRFFNPDVGVHFYTASEAERDNVTENLTQYEFEGASYNSAPESEDPLTGVKPVYRFFNTQTGVHLYTIAEAERDFIEENLEQYSSDGIAYYAYESEQEGTIPVYRFFNPVIGAHFYTPSANERDVIVENLPDYELEGGDGIAFYVEPI